MSKSLENHGLNKISESIKMLDSEYNKKQKYFHTILEITSDYYKVDKDDVINSSKRGKIKESKKMVVCLCKQLTTLTNKEICQLLNSPKTVVSQHFSYIKSIIENDENKKEEDMRFLKIFNTLSKQIKNIKSTIKNDN